VKLGVAGHSTDDGPGKAEITGQTLSVTEMVCEAWELFPQSSVAVQVRVVLYSCGHDPGVVTSLNVNEGVASQLSVAVGVVKTGVDGHSTDDGPGKDEITGAVLSSTLMVCTHTEEFPQSSVAVVVRVTLYSCGQAPGVVTSLNPIVKFKSQLSENVGVPNEGVAGQRIVAFEGQKVTVGAVLSCTVTSTKQVTGVAPQLLQVKLDVKR
jgi:hypothetical protein